MSRLIWCGLVLMWAFIGMWAFAELIHLVSFAIDYEDREYALVLELYRMLREEVDAA